jgi:Family of unknown function (DUF6152)
MRTKSKAVMSALSAIVLLSGGLRSAFAHHSGAEYDFTKNVWVSGVVKAIRVINPHMSLTLVVLQHNGKTRPIHFEGDSVNNFYRAGWRPHMVRVGDRIKVRYNPRKDGAEGGFVNGFVAANGHRIIFRLPGGNRIPARAAAPTAR